MRHSVRLVLQQVLKNDFEVFQNRDLIGIDFDYPFLDGSHFKMHDDTNAEPVMVAYAITTVSQPVLVAAEPTATEAQRRIDAFADRHPQAFPAAVRCLQDDRQALTSYLRYPTKHHKRIRHTNLIERTFGETRRRVKVIGELARTALHPSHHPTPLQHPPPTQPTCHRGDPNHHSPRRHRHSRRPE